MIGVIGGWILHRKEQRLEKRIEMHISTSGISLENQISLWQKKLTQEAQEFSKIPNVPSVRDVLAWLGDFQEPIEIVQFHYSLVHSSNNARVDLEFKAESPAMADRFQAALEKVPTLVDKKQKITWTAQKDSYKLSFSLRKV
jgi:hypothetical protein